MTTSAMIEFNGSGWIIFFTVLGVLVLWCKESTTASGEPSKVAFKKMRVYRLTPLVEMLPVSENWQTAIQLVVFVVLGTLLALAFGRPTTVVQGFTAGLGWTAGLTKH